MYSSGSNRATNFNALSRFPITSTITTELYDTKSGYQLIVSITKCKIRKCTKTAIATTYQRPPLISFFKKENPFKKSPTCQRRNIKAAGDKLLMNKFIRQNAGGGLTFKNVKS